MGLFHKIFGGPLSPQRLAKVAALASNAYAQPDVRMRELERLVADGRPEALLGALKRLASNSQGHIADEDEKQWVEDAMARAGQSAVAPLESYIKKEKQLTYALRALSRILGDEEAVGRLVNILSEMSPSNWQKSEAKLQLVWQLAPFVTDARVSAVFLGYLNDHSDDVQWAILEALADQAKKETSERALAPKVVATLTSLVCDPATSLRIAKRAASLLVETGAALPSDAVMVAGLAEDYFVDKKQHLRRRAG